MRPSESVSVWVGFSTASSFFTLAHYKYSDVRKKKIGKCEHDVMMSATTIYVSFEKIGKV